MSCEDVFLFLLFAGWERGQEDVIVFSLLLFFCTHLSFTVYIPTGPRRKIIPLYNQTSSTIPILPIFLHTSSNHSTLQYIPHPPPIAQSHTHTVPRPALGPTPNSTALFAQSGDVPSVGGIGRRHWRFLDGQSAARTWEGR